MKVLNSLGKPLDHIILNDEGKPIILNQEIQRQCDFIERHLRNALGVDIPITTMTTITKKITEQKFFTVPGGPAAYVPITVGQGAYSDQLLTYVTAMIADNIETGWQDMGSSQGRLAEVSTGVQGVFAQTKFWAKGLTWTIAQVQAAAKAGNWNLVESLEASRKKDWDLGTQRMAFLGARGLNGSTGNFFGLLNQPATLVNNNTSLITQAISTMNTVQFQTFIQGLLQAYRLNNNYTAYPTHFVIPEDDYNGMAAPLSATFPIVSFGQYLEEALKQIIPGFKKVLPCAYAIPAQNKSVFGGNGKHVYALYNYDETSLRMDVPIEYSTTPANSINGFQIQNAAFGQVTGLVPYRPLEILTFSY